VARYVLSRAAQCVLVWLLATVVVFALARLIPGDPVLSLVPPTATPDDIAAYRDALGLDGPILDQYAQFVGRLAHLDFGDSFTYRQPVVDLIAPALPVTLTLIVTAFVIALVIAVPLGVLAATRPNSALDASINLLVATGQSVPTYWLGILLIYVFAVVLGWFPTSGYGGIAFLVLPALSLVAWVAGVITAVTRASLMQALAEAYTTTARAKGMRERTVVIKHGMRNALVEITTVIALEFGFLLSGAVITEIIFGLPGIGSLGYRAILDRDYPVIQGIVLVGAALVLAVNLSLDVLYRYLDPRIGSATASAGRSNAV
jgi:peptide/nickel transport system permease protein